MTALVETSKALLPNMPSMSFIPYIYFCLPYTKTISYIICYYNIGKPNKYAKHKKINKCIKLRGKE